MTQPSPRPQQRHARGSCPHPARLALWRPPTALLSSAQAACGDKSDRSSSGVLFLACVLLPSDRLASRPLAFSRRRDQSAGALLLAPATMLRLCQRCAFADIQRLVKRHAWNAASGRRRPGGVRSLYVMLCALPDPVDMCSSLQTPLSGDK
ncbi:hypothetical protein BD414DRAFT_484158 [Trametes punicea]|nr:hypothetical protein BD414DRAFT_484158 [Trametes punicea]